MRTNCKTADESVRPASIDRQPSLRFQPTGAASQNTCPARFPVTTQPTDPDHPSARALRLMQSLPGEPFWLCDWSEVVFLHFEVNAKVLQREVPFELDRFEGRAFVSLVAFTLTDLRPRIGGRLTRFLFQPFGTHRFLNIRTYVRHDRHTGIYFLAEWLDAPRINRLFGPLLYGLPFRFGKLDYRSIGGDGDLGSDLRGEVSDWTGSLHFSGIIRGSPHPAESGSLEAFLLERYIALTRRRGGTGWFPVWHRPWRIASLDADIPRTTLLTLAGKWHEAAKFHSAHWARDAGVVWMGWHRRHQ